MQEQRGSDTISVRSMYILQQPDTIYAMAWTQAWDPGSLDVVLRAPELVVSIDRIWVPVQYRRRNYGHSLLQHICQDANRANTVLTVDVIPDDGSALDWILRMYKHAGFEPFQADGFGGSDGIFMVRWPVARQSR